MINIFNPLPKKQPIVDPPIDYIRIIRYLLHLTIPIPKGAFD